MAAKKTGVKKNTKATPVKKNTAKKNPPKKKNGIGAVLRDDDGRKTVHKFSASQIVAFKDKKSGIYTKEGIELTVKEARFIDAYIVSGNQRQSAIDAGYKCGNDEGLAGQVAAKILAKGYIKNEIKARMEASKNEGIMTREEQLQFLSDMARGKILDQFDMPATNSDKIKALVELAKRTVDIEDRLKEKQQATAPEIKISLSWEGAPDGKKE